MRLRSSPILGFICFGSILAMDTRIDCKDVAVSGLLDAMWFSAAAAVNQAQDGDDQAAQGEPGAPGEAGINCWDLDGDGVDDPEEDVNADGVWDALDCQGAQGEAGQEGQSAKGAPGEPGLMCWDLDGDGNPDANEDTNQDGIWDSRDCQGLPGADGQDGEPGLMCWDLDGDGIQDANEDTNQDSVWDARDCQGEPGEDMTGVIARGVIPGADIPDPGQPDYEIDPSKLIGIERIYRPDDGSGLPTRGRYRIVVSLPERAAPYTQDEIVILVSVEALHTDGAPPGSGGTTAQAFGFWEVVSLNNDTGVVELEVMVRTAPLNFFTDATFSLVVLVP